MMDVWTVTVLAADELEGDQLLAVFSSEEKAILYMDTLREQGETNVLSFEEWELDAEDVQ